VGEPPLFIFFLSISESAFYKVAKIETHFANLKFCVIAPAKIWRRPEQKAGNRHEKIPEVAYCHSSKRIINYICISSFGRLIKIPV
jgi:hypothetical protein